MPLRLAILAGLWLAFATPALAAPPARDVPVGTHIDWSNADEGSPAVYRSGGYTLTIQGEPDADMPEFIVPVLTVEFPGHAPMRVEGSLSSHTFDHRVTVGRWDAERPYVLFQSFSGGAHCCNLMQAVYPENGELRRVDFGEWDGGYQDELPTDRNGDGRLDFVFLDNGFLYAFTSYADSWAPPLIMNVVGDEAVNVSTDPSFRPLFAEAMARQRRACRNPGDGLTPNGACAAYVGSAARLGEFDRAWAEMLLSYDRNFEWPLPPSCPVAWVGAECPDGQLIEYDNFPDALRGFLVELGYIER